jgi:DNA polymerase-3 subunit alpha
MDGAQSVKMIASKAANIHKVNSVALTDHGRCGGLLQFKKACEKQEIKPIYGFEAYMAPKSRHTKEKLEDHTKTSYHLTLLAKTEKGLKNIFKLSSIGWLEGFYYKPRIDLEVLREHSEDLIVLSGCGSGHIAHMLMTGDIDRAKQHTDDLLEIFKDDFYIEVQNHNLDWQIPLKTLLFDLADLKDIPTVATQDSHYLNREDADMHRAICKISAGDLEFEGDESFFKSEEEMKEMFEENEHHAISRTQEVADKCNCEWNYGKTIWPVYPIEGGKTPEEELRKEAYAGFNKRFESPTEEYRQRIEYELGVIEKMGFPTYFLVVADFINWAKTQDIPVGPGRGSGAGSIVAYCLGITELDPIKYELYFERFLNPDRVSLPDFDIDFCKRRRDEVVQYIKDKYGKEKVAQIGTYSEFKPRGSLRAFARVLGYPSTVGDQLSNMVPPNVAGKTLKFEEVVKASPEILEHKCQDVVELARKAEKLLFQPGIHAAGVLISDSEISTQVPLFRGKHDEVAAQFDMHDVEDVGLVKYDFLGLKNLTVINDSIRLIKRYHGVDIDINSIPMDDQEVFRNVFQAGRLDGIFQFETSSGFRDLCIKVKPTSIKDLAAITSLFRPGPLGTGLTDKYVEGRNGGNIEYLFPQLEPILHDTYGVLCLPVGTKISTEHGLVSIEEIKAQQVIHQTDGHSIWNGKVKRCWKTGKKQIVKIQLSNGKEIRSSEDHVWMTRSGDKKAKDLISRTSNNLSGPVSSCGDVLIGQWETSKNQIDIDHKKAYLLGLLIGDGEMKTGTKSISCKTKKAAKWIAENLAECFHGEPKYYHNTRCWYAYAKFNSAPHKTPITEYLDKLYGSSSWISKSGSKSLPNNAIDYTEECRISLIRGLWDADGHYGKYAITYKSISKQLLKDISKILSSLRIGHLVSYNYIYIIDNYAFYHKIGLPMLPDKLCEIQNTFPAVPSKDLLEELRQARVLDQLDNNKKKQLMRSLTQSSMYKPRTSLNIIGFREVYKKVYIRTYGMDTYPVYINKITSAGTEECYDIEMAFSEYPYFLADGIVSHNCFQEQIMKICTDVAGYTLAEADNMRKIIGKKLPEKMKLEREKFIGGCVANQIEEAKAIQLFDNIEGFAKYCFNLAHAAAYSVISYQTAWLKTYYIEEFCCALLDNSIKDQDDLVKYVYMCKENGIPIMPPDVNISETEFVLDNGTIVFGLSGLKGMGDKASKDFAERRPEAGFTSLEHMVDLGVKKNHIKALAKCGALEEISDIPRETLLENLDALVTYYKKNAKYQARLKKIEDSLKEIEIWEANPEGKKPRKAAKVNEKHIPVMPEMTTSEEFRGTKLSFERQALGFYLTGHPMDSFPGLVNQAMYTVDEIKNGIDTQNRSLNGIKVNLPIVISSINKIRTKAGKDMASLMVEDKTGRMEATLFPNQWSKLKGLIQEDTVNIIKGYIKVAQMDDERPPIVRVVINAITPIDSDSGIVASPFQLKLKDGTVVKFIPHENQKISDWQQAVAIAENVKRMG